MSFGSKASEGAHSDPADERQYQHNERNECRPKNCQEDHLVADCLRMAKNERPQKRALRGFKSLRAGRYPTRCAGCPIA
jgi:hypothetical protein